MMKKKFLPYILGYSLLMVAPFTAQATDTAGTYFHTGHDIETSGNTVDYNDWNINTSSTSKPNTSTSDGHNEFTEYNSAVDETNGTQNKRSLTFGTPSINATSHNVDWSASGLGNTRQSTADTQLSYPVAMKNETQDLRATDISEGTHPTTAQDMAKQNFNTNDNDYFWDETQHDYIVKNNTATTDLETSISEYIMTVPAKTVLPMGATHWRLGNVKINGTYFVKPDKIDVTLTHVNFRHPDHGSQVSPEEQAKREIQFTVSDKRYTDADLDSDDHRYFFQDGETAGPNGTSTMQDHFPYAYEEYTATNYVDGLISNINETHQVWLNADANQWSGKIAGKYTGSITFNASISTTETADMYTNLYPGEGHEPDPNGNHSADDPSDP